MPVPGTAADITPAPLPFSSPDTFPAPPGGYRIRHPGSSVTEKVASLRSPTLVRSITALVPTAEISPRILLDATYSVDPALHVITGLDTRGSPSM